VGFIFFQKKKREKNKNTGFNVFCAREEEGEFYTLFGRLNDERQTFLKYIRMSTLKFENLKQLLHTDIEKNT
jgi:hypothetical protein